MARSGEVAYGYCLEPCSSDGSMVATLRFAFGGNGELQRADATYFRYSARVELVSSSPTATVKLR